MRYIPGFDRKQSLRGVSHVITPFHTQSKIGLLSCDGSRSRGQLMMALVNRPRTLHSTIVRTVKITIRLVSLGRRQKRRPHVKTISMIPFVPVGGIAVSRTISLSQRVKRGMTKLCRLPIFLCRGSTATPRHRGLTTIHGKRFRKVTRGVGLPR